MSAGACTVSEFEHDAVAESPADVIVTLPVLFPAVPYVLLTLCEEPDNPLVPLHEYVYEPFPPPPVALHVALPPATIVVGDTEHDAVTFGQFTFTEFEQLIVVEFPPDVIVTLADLLPAFPYVLLTDCAEPDNPSVPVHE